MKNFSSIKPANLRCEYKINPLGIEELNPRLSWAFQSSKENERGQKQTAYQIIVARKEENLENKKEDLWNSGKIFSDKTFQIDYKGKKLFSRQECCWQVRVWDKDGKVSQWSNLAFWKMGLLKKSDWKADWIYFDKWQLEKTAAKNYYFKKKKDKWIWNPGKKQIGNFYFRKSFTIKNLNEIKSAKLLITADEKYTLYINEKEIDKSDDRIFSWARPKLIDITPFLLEGKNAIAVEGINSYLTKPGLTVKLFLNFNDSQKIIRTNATWKSTKGKNNNWYQINFDDSEWKNSKEIILMGDKPWRIPNYELILPPPVYLRENFLIKKRVKKAYVFISALGLYHLTINGKGVTDDRLTPGWTDYNKRVHYFTYDVTKFINNSSSNTAGIILADGWYSGYVGWERRRSYYGTIPKVIFQIEIEYEDGTIETISTDKSWKANYGQIKEADLLMGEIYDAKKDNEMSGWDTFSFNDSAWEKVKVLKKQNVTLNSFAGNPIRKTEEILPINFSSPSKRIYIFDLGQNFAGCVRLKINGKNSAKIVLRFGEVLNDDGTLYVENIRMARATDTYYPKGLDEEIWEPKFTYHGFRYVELSGYNDLPNKDTIAGIVFHSDMIRAGSFVCSNKLLNKIYENIIWSQRSNFMDLPTDCPQRDERLGWTADAVDFIKTAAFNFDISSFYTKWITDLNDAQEKNGAYTAIAPKPDLGVGPLFSGAAGFADSG
ncbi:MAG: family 78 glycoside hydrolase catalytic domain, partial [Ignavibacteriaceae bacterium]